LTGTSRRSKKGKVSPNVRERIWNRRSSPIVSSSVVSFVSLFIVFVDLLFYLLFFLQFSIGD